MSQSEPLLRLVSPAALTSYLPRSEWKDCLQIKFYGAFTFRVFVFGLLALCLITVWVNAAVAPRGEWTASEDAEVEWSRGIVVDAGSSGSRVYLYQWLRHSGNPDELLKIEQMRDENGDVLVKKQEPGISSYIHDPQKAFASLEPLLDFAASQIPQSSHRDILLFVLATAGVRLATQEKQEKLLNVLRTNIRSRYSFHLPDSHVEVLTGKLEGIYGWIAVNYVLGRFDHAHKDIPTSHVPGRLPTVGALDLGGASAQIAFEVNKELPLPPSLHANINLGCDSHSTTHSHHLYVSTLLGYGSNEAFTRHHHSLLNKHRKSPNTTLTISDPCLPLNRQELVKVKGSSRRLFLTGLGNFTACRQEISKLVNRSTPCGNPPCSADGIHQPIIDGKTEFYGVGEYWYTTEMVGWSGRYDMDKYESAAKEYCHTEWSVLEERFRNGLYTSHVGWNRVRRQCFKSVWLSIILHDVYRFPRNSTFHLMTTEQISGQTIRWTLGAILYKTRYLPLQEIQRLRGLEKSQHITRVANTDIGYRGVFLFSAAVVVFVVMYLRRRKGRHWTVVSPHKQFLPRERIFKFDELRDVV